MEKILLGDASCTVDTFGQTFGIKLTHNALYPNVNGESINLAEAVKK